MNQKSCILIVARLPGLDDPGWWGSDAVPTSADEWQQDASNTRARIDLSSCKYVIIKAGASRQGLAAMRKIKEIPPSKLLKLAILELSLFSKKAGRTRSLPAFLTELDRVMRPEKVLVVGDLLDKPDGTDEGWREGDLDLLSRDLFLKIGTWRRLLLDERLRPSAFPQESYRSTNLVFDLSESRGKVPRRSRLVLIASQQAESGYHEWRVPSECASRLAHLTRKANRTPRILEGETWWRLVMKHGQELQDLLLQHRGGVACANCVRPNDLHCILRSSLQGYGGDGAPLSLDSPYRAWRGSPFVAIVRPQSGPPPPVEFLPCPVGAGVLHPLYRLAPVMHQVLGQGPPSASRILPPFHDTNFLLICTNSAHRDHNPLPEAEKEIDSLHLALTRAIQAAGGKGVVRKVLSREPEFGSFDEFEQKLMNERPDGGWHVIHWAGHADADRASRGLARFDWPTAQDISANKKKRTWLPHKRVVIFFSKLAPRPLFLNLSCCRVGATESPLRFVQLGIPYVLAHRWPVYEEEAPEFAFSFYRHWLLREQHPAVALWSVRKELADCMIAASSVLVGGSAWQT
jgi:hypothetical protein